MYIIITTKTNNKPITNDKRKMNIPAAVSYH